MNALNLLRSRFPTTPRLCGGEHCIARRFLSFSFAGPRKLSEILKLDLLEGQSASEISDIWYTYHESRESVVGICLSGSDGKKVLSRASKCPFFVQPVFRDDGFFMLISQFQDPSHFLMAYLEDYKMDPSSASPLVSFSIFNDLADAPQNLSLVRCDILNANIQDHEGLKVVQSVLDNYRSEDDFGLVRTFNERPASFDVDDYISRMNDRWKQEPPCV